MTKIYCKELIKEGNEESILFIHGSGCNHHFLELLAEELKDKYNCYLIDLPAHGKSEGKDIKDISEYIEGVNEFIEETFDKPITIVGHSLGGSIVLGLSALKSSKIKKGIVLNGSAKWSKLDEEFCKKIKEGIVDLNYLLLAGTDITNPHPLTLQTLQKIDPPEKMIMDFNVDEKLDLRDKLKDIEIPILAITGSEEILALVEYTEEIQREVKNATTLIRHGKHMLPIEDKEYIASQIDFFITH